MLIAELFVRLRGDTSDLDRKLSASERQMLRLHGSTAKLEGGFRSAQFQTGRLGNQFASLAGQIAGVHPIVGNLAQVMGNFAIGGLVTVGVLGGVAAIALAYDELTGSARKAKKAADDMTASYVNQAKAAIAATVAGRENLEMIAQMNLESVKKESGVGLRSLLLSAISGGPRMSGADVAADTKRVADAQTRVTEATKDWGKAWDETQPKIEKGKSAVDGLKFSYNQLRDAIARTRAEAERSGEEFWRNLASSMFASEELTKSLMPDGGIGPVDISDSARLAGQQAKEITDNAERNARNMQDAIWGAASQSANLIVSALNIGGGGKGSSLGGAIGSALGFAGGFVFGGGPAGGAIGSLIGNIGGSLLGGLFDSNKEAVNSNTSAVRALTQAMLLSAPSGFRVEPYRYGASTPVARNPANTTVNIYGVTDAKEVARVVMKYATRGGAPLLAGT